MTLTWEELARLMSGHLTVLYGVAGSGKTNIAMQLMEITCRDLADGEACYFISTEGPHYLNLLRRYNLGPQCFLAYAVSGEHLLKLVLDVLLSDLRVKYLAIDSINNFYRAEALKLKYANVMFNTILALLSQIAHQDRALVLVTAQVRTAPTGEEEISGDTLISFWSDVVIKCERIGPGKGELIFNYPDSWAGKKTRFEVGDEGVKLANNV